MKHEISDYKRREGTELTADELMIWINTLMGDMDREQLEALADYAGRIGKPDVKEKTRTLYKYVDDNGVTAPDYVKEWANCRKTTIGEHGNIWIADPQTGHWLDDDELEKFVEWLESTYGWTL